VDHLRGSGRYALRCAGARGVEAVLRRSMTG
jgi:hypothetical protein